MRNEELKIPKELKEGLHSALDKKAPKGIFSSVMRKIENDKKALSPIQESPVQIIAALAVILVGLFLLLPTQLIEKYNLPQISLAEFTMPLISPVFWWSLIAVCMVLYADIIINRLKNNSI